MTPMNKHVIIGIVASSFVLLGAGCAKSTPPAVPAQPEAATPAPTSEEKKVEPAAPGEVRIDLRKDETSAPPKASAGAEAKPAQSQPSQPAPSSPLPPKSPTTDADKPDQPQPAPDVPTTKSFTITASQWAFSPNTITVKQGNMVRLRVTSLDVPHGILIQGYDINKVLNPNETVTIEFTADKKGTFPFRCSVQCGGGHPDMKGQLIVE